MTIFKRKCPVTHNVCDRSPRCEFDCAVDEPDYQPDIFDAAMKWAGRLALFAAVAISAVWLGVVTGYIL